MIFYISFQNVIVMPKPVQIDQNVLQKVFFTLTGKSNSIINYTHNYIIDTSEPNILQNLSITKILGTQSTLDLTFNNLSDETIKTLTNSTYKVEVSIDDGDGRKQRIFVGDLVNAVSYGETDKTLKLTCLACHYRLSMPCSYNNLKPIDLLRNIAKQTGMSSVIAVSNKSNLEEVFSDSTNQDIVSGLDIIMKICQQYDLNWFIDNETLTVLERRTTQNRVNPQTLYYDNFKLSNIYSYDNSLNCSFSTPKFYTQLNLGNVFTISSIANPAYTNINNMTAIDIPFKVNRLIYTYMNNIGILTTEVHAQDALTI